MDERRIMKMVGDTGAAFVVGYPPFSGEPFRTVDHEGASVIVLLMSRWQDQFGKRFEPCDLLKDIWRSK